MIEALIAFAILHGGYTDWCTNVANGTCTAPAIVQVVDSPFVEKTKAGWYKNGTAYVKERDPQSNHARLLEEITIVHEFTHHLQRLSGRYHQYRGVCNQYLAEKEAYEVGEAYAKSKGYTVSFDARLVPYEQRCKAAVAAGLIRDPFQ
jgi:hypothetical protein